jgi:hypothetical protein
LRHAARTLAEGGARCDLCSSPAARLRLVCIEPDALPPEFGTADAPSVMVAIAIACTRCAGLPAAGFNPGFLRKAASQMPADGIPATSIVVPAARVGDVAVVGLPPTPTLVTCGRCGQAAWADQGAMERLNESSEAMPVCRQCLIAGYADGSVQDVDTTVLMLLPSLLSSGNLNGV